MKTYKTETSRLAAAHFAIAKSNAIAAKLGVAPATITVLNQWDEEETYGFDSPLCGIKTGRIVHMTEWQVEGIAPKFSGWRLLAVITPGGIEGQNLVKAVPGEEQELPAFLRTWDIGQCQHCWSYRARKDAFALEHEDGQIKVVGRQCLRNFLGHPDPETLWAFFYRTSELDEEFEGWGRGGAVNPEWTLDGWLGWVVKAIREHGWTSATAARDTGKMSTSSRVWNLIDDFAKGPRKENNFVRVEAPTAQDYDLAKVAVTRARDEMDPKGDYMWNLKQVVSREFMETRESGIVASLIPTYNRELEREVERVAQNAAKPASEWQGEIGKRGAWELTVRKMRVFENDFGTTTKVDMQDAAGNDFVWWASNGGAGLEVGETATVVGTVKQHGEFNGRKFTNLTRCAVKHIPSATKAG